MAVTLTATEPCGLCNITCGPSLVRVPHPIALPEGHASLHATKLFLPMLSLGVVLPFVLPLPPVLGVIPKSLSESTGQHFLLTWKGQAGEGKGQQQVSASPCCVALELGCLLELRGVAFDLSNGTQTSRKLKSKGEILDCNLPAPCLTKIRHRPGISKWCWITQLCMLQHLGKPLKKKVE